MSANYTLVYFVVPVYINRYAPRFSDRYILLSRFGGRKKIYPDNKRSRWHFLDWAIHYPTRCGISTGNWIVHNEKKKQTWKRKPMIADSVISSDDELMQLDNAPVHPRVRDLRASADARARPHSGSQLLGTRVPETGSICCWVSILMISGPGTLDVLFAKIPSSLAAETTRLAGQPFLRGDRSFSRGRRWLCELAGRNISRPRPAFFPEQRRRLVCFTIAVCQPTRRTYSPT